MKKVEKPGKEVSPSIDDVIKEAKRLYTMGFSLKDAVWLAISTHRDKSKSS